MLLRMHEVVMSESQDQETRRVLEVRGGTYRLLSRIWGKEVDEALWQELRGLTFPALPDFPGLDGAYRDLERALQQEGEVSSTLTDLAADYAILCLGASRKGGADPYESVHLSKDSIMMQDQWEQMLYLYDKLGLQRSGNTTEPEDHLAMELECMAILCQRAIGALDEGEGQDLSWAISHQIKLLDEHLLRWVPSFVGKVLKLSGTAFYKAAAVLTREFLKMDRELLDAMVSQESSRSEA